MDQNPLSHSPTPAQATIPEEDATLLAIEALEARAIDLDPVVPPPAVTPAVPEARKVIGPVIQPVPPRAPAPRTAPPPVIPQPTPEISKPVAKPVPAAPPKPIQPQKPETAAEQIAHELASGSSFPMFQFFKHSKPPRKQFVIIGSIIIVLALGVGAYFLLA